MRRGAAAREALLVLIAAAAAQFAAAAWSCPPSNPAATSCYCTSGCSINGDTTDFPWSAPVFPPVSVDLGGDTICVSIALPCSPDAAYTNMSAYLGVTGDVTMDGNSCVQPHHHMPLPGAARTRSPLLARA